MNVNATERKCKMKEINLVAIVRPAAATQPGSPTRVVLRSIILVSPISLLILTSSIPVAFPVDHPSNCVGSTRAAMSSLDLTRDWLQTVLRPYPSRERIIPEVLGVLTQWKTLAVKTDAFSEHSH